MKKQLTDSRQTPFVWFDIALDDAGLSVFAFRLYCHIARVTTGGKKPFFESLTHAATLCKMSLRSARDAMRHLEQRQMLKRTEERTGYTWVYALTDKSEWVTPPAGDAALPRQEMPGTPAGDAAPPRQEMPPHEKNKKKKQKKEEEAAAAAVPAAAAAARARAHRGAAAAASRFTELEIYEFLTATKPHNAARNSGLAHKLWLTGEDDHLIAHWQQQQADRQAELRRRAEREHAEHLRVALDLADSLLSAAALAPTERSYIPGLIETLSTDPRHADVVEQLKGLTL